MGSLIRMIRNRRIRNGPRTTMCSGNARRRNHQKLQKWFQNNKVMMCGGTTTESSTMNYSSLAKLLIRSLLSIINETQYSKTHQNWRYLVVSSSSKTTYIFDHPTKTGGAWLQVLTHLLYIPNFVSKSSPPVSSSLQRKKLNSKSDCENHLSQFFSTNHRNFMKMGSWFYQKDGNTIDNNG